MLVDANVLLYARDRRSPFHAPAEEWLVRHLNGGVRVGLPWQSLAAFVRIGTNTRLSAEPLSVQDAWRQVQTWLAAPAAWVPVPTPRHAGILGDLLLRHHVTGNLVPDAHLAALAVEHGLAVVSADTDFARFTDVVRWVNPLDG